MLLDRKYFPCLTNNPDLLYFDSAASTQTHISVIQAMNDYYCSYRSNIGRGNYPLADRAEQAVHKARRQVANLMHVDPSCVMFTSGATQSINLIAQWNANAPSVIVIEHDHIANILPWQMQGRSADNKRLYIIPCDLDFDVNYDYLYDVCHNAEAGSLLMFSATSNVTGDIRSWQYIANIAHSCGVSVAIDFSQTVAHQSINLTDNPIEWAVFSSHKMYGPTGVGILYTGLDWDRFTPVSYGSGSIYDMSWNTIHCASGVARHEVGTQNIAGIIGTGVAAELISYTGFKAIQQAEINLEQSFIAAGIHDIPGLTSLSVLSSQNIITLYSPKYYASDIGELLSTTNLAVRTGSLCAHPFVNKITEGKGAVRISIAPYNTSADCVMATEILKDTMKKL